MHLFFHLMPVLWKKLGSGSLILVNLVMALVLVIPSLCLYHFLPSQHTIDPEDEAKNDIVISHHRKLNCKERNVLSTGEN